MKYAIEYYYNITINNIREKNDNYYITDDYNKYIFYRLKSNDNISYTRELLKSIKYYPLVSTLIENKERNVITLISGEKYALLKLNTSQNKTIDINDILSFRNYYLSFNDILIFSKFHWGELWQKKIDYYEMYLKSNTVRNIKFEAIMYYYIFMGENAISYFNKAVKTQENQLTGANCIISHNRVKIEYKTTDLYNPFNLIIDHESRDIAEYLRTIFIENKKNIDDVYYILKKANLSKFGYKILYSRLLFPTYFFDLITEDGDFLINKKIVELYDFIDNYEQFLKCVYNSICKITNIPQISWLNN